MCMHTCVRVPVDVYAHTCTCACRCVCTQVYMTYRCVYTHARMLCVCDTWRASHMCEMEASLPSHMSLHPSRSDFLALFYDVTLWSDLQIPGSLTTAFPLATCLENVPFRPAACCLFYPCSAQPSDLKRHLRNAFSFGNSSKQCFIYLHVYLLYLLCVYSLFLF